jgi:hypothetical protein
MTVACGTEYGVVSQKIRYSGLFWGDGPRCADFSSQEFLSLIVPKYL